MTRRDADPNHETRPARISVEEKSLFGSSYGTDDNPATTGQSASEIAKSKKE